VGHPTEAVILPNETAPAAAPALDLDLIRKYSIAGPRYTSYPPATKFVEDVDPQEIERAIADDNFPGAGPVSLYFHIPFCASHCWYCGCNTIVTKRHDAASAYVDDISLEVAQMAARMNHRRPVTQVHFGGGTPTYLTPEELARLGMMIHENFHLDLDCEFSVEIDPRRLTSDHIEALQVIGANRASIGVQDTNPEVQLAIHRWQPHELNVRAVAWLRDAGFESINVDLIYGLPRQTPELFARTLDDVLALSPDRLSVFSYAHVPWLKPAQRIFETRKELPEPAAKLAMFAAAHAKLTAAGYVDIGLDHFARPDDELAIAQRRGTLHRNFQGYSTAGGASLYGFGITSISSTSGTYRQNLKDIGKWREAVTAGTLPVERGLVLTEEDRRRRALIMRLMCDRRLDFAALSESLGVDVAGEYAAEIEGMSDLEGDGLVIRTREGIEVTPRGAPLLRVVAMRFDATFKAGAHRHSQTV
jgi:oxygen-independent coproporphyrinogen-3 oxidase